MKIKDVAEVGVLLAVGFMLHFIFPPVFFGMKPDFTLSMLFAVILIKRNFKLALVAGLVTGIFTALTTGFPGGQVANLVDKTLVTLIFSVIILNIGQVNLFLIGLINCVGTILSGIFFLGTAAVLFGLPGSMSVLLLTVVLPAALVNTFTGIILYSTILQSKRFYKAGLELNK